MKSIKIYAIMLMTVMVLAASLSITSVKAEAKTYKTKTVKVTSGKSKTVKTKKKIKKITICSKNKNFDALYNTSEKNFRLIETDYGKTQTVKVKYTDGSTQKYKIKTVLPSYAQKIVDELKPLLADPDKGLQTCLADWQKQLDAKEKDSDCDGYEITLTIRKGLSRTIIEEMPVDDILKNLKNFTASEKKALILEAYFGQRMTYGKRCWYNTNRESNKLFKLLYQGKFKGVCQDGALIAYDICKYLGIKAYYVSYSYENHAWCCVYATDKNGKSYWRGIYATSYAYNLKASIPAKFNYGDVPGLCWGTSKKRLTKAKLKKYLYSPASTSLLVWVVY